MGMSLAALSAYAVTIILAVLYNQDDQNRQRMTSFYQEELARDKAESDQCEMGCRDEFDYIIVGGGTAGSILANRLSASGLDKVLVIEAGGDPNIVYEVPYGMRYFWTNTVGNNKWDYSTTKQNNACLRANGVCGWPKGKALGGCSSINGLLYNRCLAKDYNNWASFTGDQSWNWSNVLKTYNSFEDYNGYYSQSNSAQHGKGGEMYVNKMDYAPGADVVKAAFNEKGFLEGDSNSGEFNLGFSRMDYLIQKGLRRGSYQSFLRPVIDRPNLKIYKHALATKIEFVKTCGNEGRKYRAEGVTYQRHGKTRTAYAKKEVILSAGTMESPKLLMLSGVGPYEDLNKLGIETIFNLPVGKYLQEHVALNTDTLVSFVVNETFAVDHKKEEYLEEYKQSGTGPLATFGTNTHLFRGYLNSYNNADKSFPDLHVGIFQNHNPSNNKQGFHFQVELTRMETSGSIKLASRNYQDSVLINPNFFADEADIDKVVDGVEQIWDIFMNSQALKKYGIRAEWLLSVCPNLSGRDYWRCAVKQLSRPTLHPTSTCRMGSNHIDAVLDSKLRVHGTQNLRVIDSSSIPFVPSGNTMLPAMLMGAKGAEIIMSGN